MSPQDDRASNSSRSATSWSMMGEFHAPHSSIHGPRRGNPREREWRQRSGGRGRHHTEAVQLGPGRPADVASTNATALRALAPAFVPQGTAPQQTCPQETASWACGSRGDYRQRSAVAAWVDDVYQVQQSLPHHAAYEFNASTQYSQPFFQLPQRHPQYQLSPHSYDHPSVYQDQPTTAFSQPALAFDQPAKYPPAPMVPSSYHTLMHVAQFPTLPGPDFTPAEHAPLFPDDQSIEDVMLALLRPGVDRRNGRVTKLAIHISHVFKVLGPNHMVMKHWNVLDHRYKLIKSSIVYRRAKDFGLPPRYIAWLVADDYRNRKDPFWIEQRELHEALAKCHEFIENGKRIQAGQLSLAHRANQIGGSLRRQTRSD